MQGSIYDTIRLEGNFKAYIFPKTNPEHLTLIYEDHNQIQDLGNEIFAEMISPNLTSTKPILTPDISSTKMVGTNPYSHKKFTNMRASSLLYNDGVSGNAGISKSALMLPGEETLRHPRVKETVSFSTEYSLILNEDQYITCNGIFDSLPDGFSPAVGEGAFIHFGLYLSRFKDTEEVLYAYKHIENGLAFENIDGLKIVWTIYLRS